jgi:8-oxo-dGTP pyrophosphatase MutT (NUDIX family)
MKEISFGIAPYKIIEKEVFLYVCKSSSISEYGFIKGKIEKEESRIDCVIREVKEETNLNIKKEYLEKFFFEKTKRKDIGIFLINEKNIDFNLIKLNKEIYSFELKKLDKELHENFCMNQKKLLNEIFLEFKNKNKLLISLF